MDQIFTIELLIKKEKALKNGLRKKISKKNIKHIEMLVKKKKFSFEPRKKFENNLGKVLIRSFYIQTSQHRKISHTPPPPSPPMGGSGGGLRVCESKRKAG